MKFLRRLPRPLRYKLLNLYFRVTTGCLNGRYVAWGATRRLDVQIGSRRDLMLARVERRRVTADRAWTDACARAAR